MTEGRRVYLKDGALRLAEGEYGKDERGVWMARPPRMHMGDLSNHEVTEHDDGTITVSPSIVIVESDENGWHGYLERGVWREV